MCNTLRKCKTWKAHMSSINLSNNEDVSVASASSLYLLRFITIFCAQRRK